VRDAVETRYNGIASNILDSEEANICLKETGFVKLQKMADVRLWQ
jgi:hypothetical protein